VNQSDVNLLPIGDGKVNAAADEEVSAFFG
jgi:hypothetical protein